jgi:hypothetical protein
MDEVSTRVAGQREREMDLGRQITQCRCRGEVRVLHSKPVVRPCEHEELTPVADRVPVEDERACSVGKRVVVID